MTTDNVEIQIGGTPPVNVEVPKTDATGAANVAVNKADEANKLEQNKAQPKGDEIVPFEYAPVEGDPGLTMALNFVGNLGITPEHPAMQEALKGNFDFLTAHLAQMGVKAQGYEQIIKLAKQSFDANVAKDTAKQSAAKEAILSVAGGEEQWALIRDWAKANADPEEKVIVNQALNAGGLMAKMATQYLRDLYSKAEGTVVEPASAAKSLPANSSSGASGAITAEQFQTELSKLVKQYGTMGVVKTPEYKALEARRAAARN